ncbi:MAG: hypothetical protein EOO85_18440 [Pedobacter sp.]|nr:MAG: hypothetical protein EOO85_18440 [Pedobacter sp.]
MKFGMKNMLGLGFIAALMGLANQSKADAATEAHSPFGTARIAFGSPIWFGNSQKQRRTNRLKVSKNAKRKNRRSAR